MHTVYRPGGLRTPFLNQRNKIVFWFFLAGLGWIFFSDIALDELVGFIRTEKFALWQTLKIIGAALLGTTFLFLFRRAITISDSVHETQYKRLFEANPNPMWIYDLKTLRFLAVNQAAVENYGYAKAEFLSMTIRDIWPAADVSLLENTVRKVKKGYHLSGAWRHVRKDGSMIHVEISGYGLVYNDQNAEWVTAKDVTAQVRAEKELKELNNNLNELIRERTDELLLAKNELEQRIYELNYKNREITKINQELQEANNEVTRQAVIIREQKEEQFNRILEKLNDVIWSYDIIEGKIDYLSRSAEATYGKSLKELQSNTRFWYDCIHPEDKGIKTESEKEAFEKGYSECTYRIINFNGQIRWLYDRVVLIRDAKGNPVRLEGIGTDITYIKQTEEIIRNNELTLHTVFKNLNFLLCLLDPKGKVIHCNKASKELLKLGFAPVRPGLMFQDVAPLHHKKPIQSIIDRVNETKTTQHYISKYDTSESTLYFSVYYNPVFDDSGELVQICLMASDITERKLASEKILEMNERYRLVSMATGDAIWDWDFETDKLFWGEGYQTLFGYDVNADKMDATSWSDRLHPEDRKRVCEEINTLVDSGEKTKWTSEYRYLKADGTYANVIDKGFLIRDDAGKAVRMIGAMQDVTEKTKHLEEIKKLSLVASKTENSVIITNKDLAIEWVNIAFEKIFHYSLSDVIHKNPLSFLMGHEPGIEVEKQIVSKLKKGEIISEEILNYSKHGDKVWVKLHINPIYDEAGIISKFIFMQSDITAQKEYELQITGIARELAALIQHANSFIFGIDRNGYINEWNLLSTHITGYAKNEVYGKKIADQSFIVESRDHVERIFNLVLKGEVISNYELPVKTKDNREVTILLNATPRKDHAGKITGILAVGQDITELTEYRTSLEVMVKARTRELHDALQKEKELADMKSRFVSMASHEFRTPLATIQFATNFLKKYNTRLTAGDIEKKLDSIAGQVGHMSLLLDDILTLGKSDAGKIQVSKNEINLRNFLRKVIEEVERSTGHTHRVDFNYLLSYTVINSDEKLMRNIFINLLTNAIKFSPGQQTVSLRVSGDREKISVSITDRGIGISSDELEKIFEPFNRGGNVNSIQGTGLGLSIVRKAVTLLEGNIELKSNLNQGTTFTIVLNA